MTLTSPDVQQVATAAAGEALRNECAAFTRGRDLHKRHWISMAAGVGGGGITRDLIEDLVAGSYGLATHQASPRR